MMRAGMRLIGMICLGLGVSFWSGCERNVHNLGGGFTIVHEKSADHARHLYFGSKDLGTVGQCYISPSSCHAIYDQEGKLILFHSCSETFKTITNVGTISPSHVTWTETRNEAKVALNGRTDVVLVPLSACACRVENRALGK